MRNDVKTRQRGNIAQYQSVANVLKVRMITIGMKQNELSERLGISQSRVSNYLNGKSEPDFHTLSKMAEYLGISLNDLVRNAETLLGDENLRTTAGSYDTEPKDLNHRDEQNELNHPHEAYMPFIVAKKLRIRDSVTNAKNLVSLPPQVAKMVNVSPDALNKNGDEQMIILEITEKIYSSKIVVNIGDVVFAVPYSAGMDVGDDALLVKPGKNFSVLKLSRTLSINGEHTYTALQEHCNQGEGVGASLDTIDLSGYHLVTAVLQVM